jgi:hypothetical protein
VYEKRPNVCLLNWKHRSPPQPVSFTPRSNPNRFKAYAPWLKNSLIRANSITSEGKAIISLILSRLRRGKEKELYPEKGA